VARRRPDPRLARLIGISDELERSIGSALAEETDARDLKEIALAIKEAIAIKRNLLDIPTGAERESRKLAREKLKAERAAGDGESGRITVEFSDPDCSD